MFKLLYSNTLSCFIVHCNNCMLFMCSITDSPRKRASEKENESDAKVTLY